MFQFALRLSISSFTKKNRDVTHRLCGNGVHGAKLPYGFDVVPKGVKLVCAEVKGFTVSPCDTGLCLCPSFRRYGYIGWRLLSDCSVLHSVRPRHEKSQMVYVCALGTDRQLLYR